LCSFGQQRTYFVYLTGAPIGLGEKDQRKRGARIQRGTLFRKGNRTLVLAGQ